MNAFKRIVLILVIVLFPLLAFTSAMRLALTPVYINFEYRQSAFPSDPYGFSTAERLHWAQLSLDYLLAKIPHSQFYNMKLPDGAPLFNARELAHMMDVRRLSLPLMNLWKVLLVFFLCVFALSFHGHWQRSLLSALRASGLAMILLIGLILLLVWLNFDQLFTAFHRLFFEGDTWLFYPSDNLIRLFPMRFWSDLFIFIGGLTILICLLPLILERALQFRLNQKAQ